MDSTQRFSPANAIQKQQFSTKINHDDNLKYA